MDGSSAAQLAADSGGRPVVKQQRKNNFYLEEKELLVSLIERHAGVLESQEHKRAGGKSKQRAAAWDDIHRRFNDTNRSGPERSVAELKRCYNNLKQRIKKVLDARREAPAKACSIKMDDRLLSRIMQLAPEEFGSPPDLHGEHVGASESDSKDLMDIKTEDGESAIVKQEDALDDCSFEVQPGPGVIKAEFDDDHSAYETHSKEDEPSDSREDESSAVKLEPFEDEAHSKEDESSDSREDESSAVKLEPFEGPVPIVKDEPMDDAHEDSHPDRCREESTDDQDHTLLIGTPSFPKEESPLLGARDGAGNSPGRSSHRRVRSGRTARNGTATGTPQAEADGARASQTKREAGTTQIICQICKVVFESKAVMVNHFRQCCRSLKTARSPTGGQDFKCSICQKTLANKDSLTKHVKYFHEGKKPHCCTLCGKSFSFPDELRRHQPTHISTCEMPHVCEQCGKGFTGKNDLRKHLRTHTKEKPFICGICQRGFARKHVLENHIRTHTREKPFKCDRCDKRYGRKDVLAEHQKEHSEYYPYQCGMCGKYFPSKLRLFYHCKSYNSCR